MKHAHFYAAPNYFVLAYPKRVENNFWLSVFVRVCHIYVFGQSQTHSCR